MTKLRRRLLKYDIISRLFFSEWKGTEKCAMFFPGRPIGKLTMQMQALHLSL
jgi:hypothetical protein